jgi:hypothetical protein
MKNKNGKLKMVINMLDFIELKLYLDNDNSPI